jgi:hypothetical protein
LGGKIDVSGVAFAKAGAGTGTSSEVGMPEAFRHEGFVFHFYSNEGNEPLHVHVRKAGGFAKFWLDPVSLEYSQGMKPRDLARAEDLILEHIKLIREKWDEAFHR